MGKNINTLIFVTSLLLNITNCAIVPAKKVAKKIEGMVYVPAGYFFMGSLERDGQIGIEIGRDELPQHRMNVPGFYIDKYEVSNLQYNKFLDATGNKPPLIWFDPMFQYYKVEGNHPAMDVSWYDANNYCKWVGKRLPTEREWEKAARGDDARIYPWGGKTFDPKKCNMQVYDKNGYMWTVPVDSMPEGQSPYGAYNMCGNVAEWTNTWYRAYPGSKLAADNFDFRKRVLRGGAYELDSPPFGRTADRHYVYPGLNFPMNGIRCAKDD